MRRDAIRVVKEEFMRRNLYCSLDAQGRLAFRGEVLLKVLALIEKAESCDSQ